MADTTCLDFSMGMSDLTITDFRCHEESSFQTAARGKKTSSDLISRQSKSYFCP